LLQALVSLIFFVSFSCPSRSVFAAICFSTLPPLVNSLNVTGLLLSHLIRLDHAFVGVLITGLQVFAFFIFLMTTIRLDARSAFWL